jgi:hypothetical protein
LGFFKLLLQLCNPLICIVYSIRLLDGYAALEGDILVQLKVQGLLLLQ